MLRCNPGESCKKGTEDTPIDTMHMTKWNAFDILNILISQTCRPDQIVETKTDNIAIGKHVSMTTLLTSALSQIISMESCSLFEIFILNMLAKDQASTPKQSDKLRDR